MGETISSACTSSRSPSKYVFTTELTSSYIFLGCSRQRDATTAARAFEAAGNKLGVGNGGLLTPSSPYTAPTMGHVPTLSLEPGYTETIHDVGAPLSPFHYQLRKVRILLSALTEGMAGSVSGGKDS
jgi:hypothetical protein